MFARSWARIHARFISGMWIAIVAANLGSNTWSYWLSYRTMMFPRSVFTIFILIAVATAAAGCALFPKNSLTDIDIPAAAGTSYTVYQNSLEEQAIVSVSYTHLRAHETRHDLVCRL